MKNEILKKVAQSNFDLNNYDSVEICKLICLFKKYFKIKKVERALFDSIYAGGSLLTIYFNIKDFANKKIMEEKWA